ncbi:MAG: T9SS type A sorting domain-containing protein, partial [Spirochaetales bacterium]|nr:T9SS type A sorting domain-containing protein [Spirochaetales bacterium]
AATSGAADIILTASNALDLGTISAGQNLTATATNGAITDSGNLTVTGGTATFAAGSNTITLNTAANNIPATTINSTANVTLASNNPIALATTTNLTGFNVNVNTCTLADDLDVNGDLSITGGTLDVVNGTDWQINVSGTWNNAGGTFEERQGLVVFDGAACVLQSNETFYDLTITNGNTLDVNGNQLAIAGGGTFDIENGATLYRTGIGGELAPTDVNSGRVTYRGAGGTVQAYAGVDYFDLEINGAGTFTLTGDTDIDNDLIISGGNLDVDNAQNYQLNIAGDFNNSGGVFTCRQGEVVFDGPAGPVSQVLGSNTFYNFTCTVIAKTLQFQAGQTTTIASGGVFRIDGSGGGPPPAPANWIHLRSTAPPAQWFFNLSPGAILNMQYVFVHDSNATNPIVIPPNIDASDNCTNWILILSLSNKYTEDNDGNGKIERIRIVAAANLNDDFSGLQVVIIDNYSINTSLGINGFSTGSNPAAPLPGEVNDNTFYIWLVEKPYLDTGSTPDFRIPTNTSLSDGALPVEAFLEYGATVHDPTDTAIPIIGYTLVRSNTSQVYVHLSEPVIDGGGGSIAPANFEYGAGNNPAITPIGAREYLLNFAAPFSIADIVAPVNITYLNIEDPVGNTLEGGAGTITHRVSDLAIGAPGDEPIVPYLLFDQSPREPGPGGVGYITLFDLTDWLQDFPDQTDPQPLLQANFGAAQYPVALVWDTNVSSVFKSNGLWLPTGANTYGLVPIENGGISSFAGITFAGVPPDPNYAEFTIELDTEPELVTEVVVEFFIEFTGSGIYAARLARPNASDWYRSVKPWGFGIHRAEGNQKGNVTIYNNVINPNAGEQVKLHYILKRSGSVTIQVFTLSGDIVDVLFRGSLGAGEHSTAWDGRNRGGRVVAKGMYFIRIVGPDMDETRKVLVVK